MIHQQQPSKQFISVTRKKDKTLSLILQHSIFIFLSLKFY